jgi:hypothetical protein
MKLLYQSAGGSALALANEDDELYVVQLVGKIGRKNYQTALREVAKNASEDAFPALLLNVKDLQSQPDYGGYWFWAHFIPRFYKKVGKCKVAIVRSKQTVWHNQLGNLSQLLKKVEVRFFESVDTAQDWLIDGILPEQTTLKETLQKKLPKVKLPKVPLPNPFKKKKTQKELDEEELDEELEDFEDEENPKQKKRFFLLKAWDWLRKKVGGLGIFKNVKVRVKFDPKGRLGEEEDD